MSEVPKVLVVDDEESIRFSLQRFLTDAGFHVRVASHALDVKEMLGSTEFNVAVVDRILVNGEDGVDLAKHIKSVQPYCQTILISAYPSFESAAESLRSEAFAYLTKPVRRDQICSMVREASAKRRLIDEREAQADIMERQLIQASKMEAAGQLASGIAHDFNNLLQVIAGNADLLLVNKQEGHPDYLRLKQIEGVCRRSKQLIRRLLDLCNDQESCPEITDINSVLRKTDALLRDSIPKNIEVEMRLSKDLLPVELDPYQFEQCILNLVINARDAIAEKGSLGMDKGNQRDRQIVITTENVTLDEEHFKQHPWLRRGKHVQVTISDTGIGMTESIRNRIFDPLFTTKGEGNGTGLGLSMACRIVKNHEGAIAVESEPGRGSSFKIYLPAVQTRQSLSPVIRSEKSESMERHHENPAQTER